MNEEASHETREKGTFITNAVIITCLIGIIIVAALIVVTPRRKEPFTQLWLKPWKLNLTNASGADPTLQRIRTFFNTSMLNTSILATSVFGHPLYVFERTPGSSPDVWFSGKAGEIRIAHLHDTIHLGPNSFFLDDVDQDRRQMLLWEYPRTLDPLESDQVVRFAFVVENDLGKDHEYVVSVSLSSAQKNVTKVVEKVTVSSGERRTCVISFPLKQEEIDGMKHGDKTKIAATLDTGEEVFFWLGAS